MATPNERNVVIPMESAESLKANLRQVADELTRVRDRTREEAESLDRIRGMLDLKYLNDLLSVIDQLEARVKQVESGAEQRKYIQELEVEQRRLAKLWDAFKTQEDQLKALERERDDILAEYRKLEKALADLGSPAKVKARILELENKNQNLRNDAARTATRLEEYVKLFTQEQERLAKLYKVFEDTEARLSEATTKLAKFEGRQSRKTAKATPAKPKAAPAKKGVLALPLAERRRRYQAEFAAFKKRAKSARGGKGPYAKRPGALALRKKYGL
jgi:chromosome segregation ATPase